MNYINSSLPQEATEVLSLHSKDFQGQENCIFREGERERDLVLCVPGDELENKENEGKEKIQVYKEGLWYSYRTGKGIE